MQTVVVPVFLSVACAVGLCLVLLLLGYVINPRRSGRVKQMPYESGMDPIHDARRRFDVRFHLLAIAFLVFDVELLFLYPWAVATRPAAEDSIASAQAAGASQAGAVGIDAAVAAETVSSRGLVFAGAMVFVGLLALGFVYDWRKGVFRWR